MSVADRVLRTLLITASAAPTAVPPRIVRYCSCFAALTLSSSPTTPMFCAAFAVISCW